MKLMLVLDDTQRSRARPSEAQRDLDLPGKTSTYLGTFCKY